MVSLVFTAFQVSTVVAQDPIMDARMADEARIQAERQAEDVAKNEARQAEDDAKMAQEEADRVARESEHVDPFQAINEARQAEDDARQAERDAADEAMRADMEAERATHEAAMEAANATRQAEDDARMAARQAEDTATQASRQKDDEDRHAAWMKEDEERFAAGAPTGGDDGSPIDPRTITPENPAGTPFTQADEVKYQIYADECETSGGTISAASLALLINDGFTEEMVNGLCQMSANEVDCMIHPAGPARDACLAN